MHDYQDSVLLNIKCETKRKVAEPVGRRAVVPVSRVVVAAAVKTSPNHTRVSVTASRARRIFCAPFPTI